jgi:hypothetical protein
LLHYSASKQQDMAKQQCDFKFGGSSMLQSSSMFLGIIMFQSSRMLLLC